MSLPSSHRIAHSKATCDRGTSAPQTPMGKLPRGDRSGAKAIARGAKGMKNATLLSRFEIAAMIAPSLVGL